MIKCRLASQPFQASGPTRFQKHTGQNSLLLPLPICLLSFSAHQRKRQRARVIKGPAFLLWAWENVEKQISCLALNLRMIKNKVNPVAAEGTSSCEGAREKKGKGETEEEEEEG